MDYLVALLIGALLTLAFAPFSLYPFAILSPAVLLLLWLRATPKQAFFLGWWYGLGLFGTGVYWVFISIHTYGYASLPVATFITAGFISLLALFPAFTGYLLTRFFPGAHPTKLLCAFPVIWLFLEWVRSWLLTGFPWLTLGYSQMDSPLRGLAPILSVYGVSLAILISSGLLVNMIIHKKQAILSLCGLIIIWSSSAYLTTVSWTHPFSKPIKVTLVQGDIPQDLKWSYEEVFPTLHQYKMLSANHWDSQLVIWPEAAIPIILQDATDFLDEVDKIAKKHDAGLITGIPIKDENKQAYYNGVIAKGSATGVYLKHRLVPFGEYIPFSSILNNLLNNILNIPLPNSIPATLQQDPIQIKNIRIATFICYEIAFPAQVSSINNKVNLILTVSNDAWFGHSIAQAQHLEMGQMRALELGRPVLFVSNNGITAIINAKGEIQAAAPPFQPVTLTGLVQTRAGMTPWQQFSLAPILIIMLLLLGIAIQKR